MSIISFADAKKTTVNAGLFATTAADARTKPAYDSSLQFNRVIASQPNKVWSTIFSIDAHAVFNALRNDNITVLSKITLAGRPNKNRSAMWDVFFNNVGNRSASACILLADSNYNEIDMRRVVESTRYLDYTKNVTRAEFNRVLVGDKVGFALYDSVQQMTYVLFFNVSSICHVEDKSREESFTLPGFNCDLEVVYRVDRDNGADLITVDKDSKAEEKGGRFLTLLINNVRNIKNAFAFKPHLRPLGKEFNRQIIEDRLFEDLSKVQEIEYDDLMDRLRSLYASRRSGGSRIRRDGDEATSPTKRPPVPELPEIETFTNAAGLYVNIPNPKGTSYETVLVRNIDPESSERFLRNEDLPKNLDDVSDVLILSPSRFGENALFRYLSVNF